MAWGQSMVCGPSHCGPQCLNRVDKINKMLFALLNYLLLTRLLSFFQFPSSVECSITKPMGTCTDPHGHKQGGVMTEVELGWFQKWETLILNVMFLTQSGHLNISRHVGSKAKCLITVFHDTVIHKYVSYIKSHRMKVTQVKQNRKCMNVFMYTRMCFLINSKWYFFHSVMQHNITYNIMRVL